MGAESRPFGAGRNGLLSVIHCSVRRGEALKRDQRGGGGGGGGGEQEAEAVGSGDESCGTIFHSRQKHLLGYQFAAAEQSSPPALSSIIFSY